MSTGEDIVGLAQHDEDLWSIEYELAWQGGWIPIPVRTTVIRLGAGERPTGCGGASGRAG